jgi:dehydrodolichyl diphosphate syntase complex subunit NUS1
MASTGVTPTQATAFHRNKLNGKPLTPKEREELLKPFLPDALQDSPTDAPNLPRKPSGRARKQKASFIKQCLFVVIYTLIHAFFSVHVRFRRAYHLVVSKIVAVIYYHHRTPEFIQRDVRGLNRLPAHLSVILDFHDSDEDQGNAGLEGLVDDVCEIAAWCACAGIPNLSIYEKQGMTYPRVTKSGSNIVLQVF